jgi:hypothetical protein
MNKKTALAALAAVMMGSGLLHAASGPVTLANDPGLAVNTTYQINLQNFITPQSAASKLAVQVTWSSNTYSAATFTDGSESTGSVTFASQNLLATPATDQITVPTTAKILGSPATAQITIVSTQSLVGVPASYTIVISSNVAVGTVVINGDFSFSIGSNWTQGFASSNTAVNLASAINTGTNGLFTGTVTASTGVIVACVSSGTACNSYTTASSTPAAISSGPFSGGYNPAVVTINGLPLVANKDFLVINTTTGTAGNLSNAILTNFASVLVSTNVGAVVYTTATVIGSVGNAYTLASSTVAISTSSAKFSGGNNRALQAAVITINGVAYVNGDNWSDQSNTSTGTALSIAGLFGQTLGAITATNVTNSGQASTGTIVVASTSNLTGATVAIGGNVTITIANGDEWNGTNTTSGTAASIAAGINLFSSQTGVVASTALNSTVIATATVSGTQGNSYTLVFSTLTGSNFTTVSSGAFSGGVGITYGSVVYATATAASAAGNTYTLTASTTNLTVSSSSFLGGQDTATFTINGKVFTAGVSYSTGTTTTDATNLATAITNSSTTIGVVASGAGALLVATSTVNGASTNYAMSTNQTGLLTLSGAKMTGGTTSATTVSTSTINIPSHGFTRGLEVVYSTGSGVTMNPLVNGTTYFVIVVDANDVQLALASTSAVAGTSIVITSSSSQTTAHNLTLTPEPFVQGTASGKFQVSNDGINWNDFLTTAQNVTVSSNTFVAVNPSSSAVQDWGPIDYGWLQYTTIAPTQGGVKLKVILNAKD